MIERNKDARASIRQDINAGITEGLRNADQADDSTFKLVIEREGLLTWAKRLEEITLGELLDAHIQWADGYLDDIIGTADKVYDFYNDQKTYYTIVEYVENIREVLWSIAYSIIPRIETMPAIQKES